MLDASSRRCTVCRYLILSHRKKVEKHAFYIKRCHNVANGYMRKTAGADKSLFEEIDSLQASPPSTS